MNKNRKIVALICALAMVLSMFAGFTVVSAADVAGMTLEVTASTATSATVVAKYEGLADGIAGATVNFTAPAGTKVAKATAGIPGASVTANDTVDGQVTSAVTGLTGNTAATDGATIATFELTWTADLAEDFTIELLDSASMTTMDPTTYEFTEYLVSDSTLAKATAVIPKYVDPNATVAPTPVAPTVTRKPMVTPTPADPDATVAPTKEPVEVTVGMTLEVADVTDTNATVIAKYVGFADGIAGATVNFTVPAGTKVASATAGIPGASVTANDTVDGQVTSAVTGLTGNTAATDGATVATFVLNLAAPVEEDFIVELLGSASMTTMDPTTYEFTEYLVSDGTLPAAWTTIPGKSAPVETIEPTEAPEQVGDSVALGDLVDAGVAEDTVTDGVSDYYIGVKVTTEDGEDAVYGEDYVAELNGEELTEDEFNNLVNGYIGGFDGIESIADVINGLEFKSFKDGINFYAELVDASNNEVVDSGDATVEEGDKEETTLTVSPKTKSVKVGDKVTITPTVKNGDLANVTASITTGEDLATFKLDDTTKKATLNAAATGKVVVTYVYDDGKTVLEATSTITITKASTPTISTGTGSGTGSTGGTGVIAGPATGDTTGGAIVPTFTDLGSVAWAQEAINTLAMRGIINGRDAYTFDPNANITRAEYAQILVGAIGKMNESADVQYDDVATDAWYYHAVAVASKYGIIQGYGDGNFGPNNLITRRDMALMTYKAAQVMGTDLSAVREMAFADADQFDYAAEAVTTLANAGIINGMSDTEFAPLANATRAQAAKILYDTFVK